MNWNEVRAYFEARRIGWGIDWAADLVAEVFHQVGISGVVMEEPPSGRAPDEAARPGQGPGNPAVVGYFPDDDQFNTNLERLEAGLRALQRRTGIRTRLDRRGVAEEDWAESWKKFFFPQRIGRRIVVKPTWQPYEARDGDLILEIDPQMAFGSGTHATTQLCVCLLEEFVPPAGRILDVGTGSGILMLAAARLGAEVVHGIDNDAHAAAIARRNMVRNSIDPAGFEIRTGHLIRDVAGTYDLVVANILYSVIMELLNDVGTILNPGGCLICSGILENQLPPLVAAMKARGFQIQAVHTLEDWAAVAGRISV